MENIIENNRLIAEFMGWESNRFENMPEKMYRMNDGELCGIHQDQLEYHSSWDWLMPVVEAIESIKYWVCIQSTYTGIGRKGDESPFITRTLSSLRHKKIESTYQCIVDFIKWYNSPKTQP